MSGRPTRRLSRADESPAGRWAKRARIRTKQPITHRDKRSLYGRLEDAGHTIEYIREEITAQPATREEAERLDMPAGVPVIDLWHTGMTAEKKPFEVTNFRMRADYSALDYDMPVEH